MTQRRGTQLVLLVILLQVLVATVALAMPAPARFGFQMFAGYESGNSVSATDGAGADLQVEDLDLWHRPLRPELDWTERLPGHVCANVPEAQEVIIYQHRAGREVVSCP